MSETRDPNRDQPLPTPGKVDIQLYLMKALVARREHGIRKYGRPLESHNGRMALLDLWEELFDALLYLTQQLTEMGVPLEGVPIPEGHPAYNLVQDLIEGDGPTQDAARDQLARGVWPMNVSQHGEDLTDAYSPQKPATPTCSNCGHPNLSWGMCGQELPGDRENRFCMCVHDKPNT